MNSLELLSFLVIGVGASAQGITGMGFGLICAPFLIQRYGPAEGVQQVVTLSLVLNAAFFMSHWRAVRGREAFSLLMPALIVAPLMSMALRSVNVQALLAASGLVTLLSAAALWRGVRWRWLKGSAGAIGAGILSAAMNVMGGLAGPAAALYAVNAAWPTASVRPTLQLYGLGLNIVTLLSLGVPPLRPTLWLSLALGLLIGSWAVRAVPPERVKTLILLLATLGGGLVLRRAFL